MSDQSLQQLLVTNFGLLPSGYTGSQGIAGNTGYTGSAGTGGGSEIQPATFNSTTITANITVGVGYSAVSVGPLTVADGVTVSIDAGQKWVIL
jgi:hypothetical protein